MIRDRLPELKEVVCTFHVSTESLVLIEPDGICEYLDRSRSPVMDALLKMYSEILTEIDHILANIESMKIMTQAKNSKQFNDREFYKLRQNALVIGNNIMSKFQTIEATLPPQSDYSTLARMKRSLYYGIFQHYVIAWSKNDEFFHEYEHKLKKNLQMQSKILNYDLTEEEIDTLVAHKFTSLYTGNILETEQARKTLDALRERLGELQKLEKSIEEVHTLFIRLQNLIVDQSVIMQSIEKHFNDARNYVEAGAEEIKEARVLQRKNRRYSEILTEIDHILANIESMKIMTQAKNSKQFNDREFYKLRQNALVIGNNIMSKFQTIEATLPPQSDYSTLARMKRSLYYGIFQHYVIAWSKNDEFFHEYEHKLKKNLQMQSKILNYDLTEEEIDTLVAHKFTSLYTGNILETEQARKTLDALRERLGELQKLEKSIEEVHTLFIRLQNLIVDQSVIMQSIEKHFNDARNYVEAGAEEIKEARVLQRKNRRSKLIFIIVTVIAVSLFMSIALSKI